MVTKSPDRTRIKRDGPEPYIRLWHGPRRLVVDRNYGLDDLEFLFAGDALLTRRAKAKSARHAVVVRFSKRRGRYERQGLLVEPQALTEAQRELA